MPRSSRPDVALPEPHRAALVEEGVRISGVRDRDDPVVRPNAGEAGRSSRGATAAGEADGNGIPSPSATAEANDSSTLRRLASIRVRMAGISHVPSSNVKPPMMCSCSTGVWLRYNCRAWAVVVGEGLGADPALVTILGDLRGTEATIGCRDRRSCGPGGAGRC